MFQTTNIPLILLAATILAIHSLPARNLTVLTPCGEVTGSISTSASRPIAEFHNIPYAEPPVGRLRFSPPRRYHGNNRWSRRVDATQDKVIKCVQGGVLKPVTGTEDCLVLTIRSPDVTTPRPVLVWIHGGGLSVNYCCEQGYTFDAHLTDTMDVVIVSINYRLGFLGFQSIEQLRDGERRGNLTPNNGLRDMIEALHWIQENIAHFGGDPLAVTLLGHSAGASATLALIASPLATNTFHRVMALSPATEMRLNSSEGSVYQEMLYDAVRRSGCDVASNIRQCLLQLPAEIFTSYRDFNPSGKLAFYNFNGYFDFPNNHTAEADFAGWLLTDEQVVPLPPRQLYKMQETYLVGTTSPISTMEVLISNTLHENSYASMFYQYNIITDYDTLNNTLKDVIPRVTPSPVDDVMTMIYEEYGSLSPQSIWDMLVTDIRSTCPTNELAAAMSQSSHHHIYRLLVDASPNNIPPFHGIDAEILFGYVFTSPVADTSGKVFRNLRHVMVDLIADFVKFGVPSRQTFPPTTMRLSNSGPDVSLDIGTDIPREKICERLRSLGLSGYGWQN